MSREVPAELLTLGVTAEHLNAAFPANSHDFTKTHTTAIRCMLTDPKNPLSVNDAMRAIKGLTYLQAFALTNLYPLGVTAEHSNAAFPDPLLFTRSHAAAIRCMLTDPKNPLSVDDAVQAAASLTYLQAIALTNLYPLGVTAGHLKAVFPTSPRDFTQSHEAAIQCMLTDSKNPLSVDDAVQAAASLTYLQAIALTNLYPLGVTAGHLKAVFPNSDGFTFSHGTAIQCMLTDLTNRLSVDDVVRTAKGLTQREALALTKLYPLGVKAEHLLQRMFPASLALTESHVAAIIELVTGPGSKSLSAAMLEIARISDRGAFGGPSANAAVIGDLTTRNPSVPVSSDSSLVSGGLFKLSREKRHNSADPQAEYDGALIVHPTANGLTT